MPDPINEPPTGYGSLARDGLFREGELRLPGHLRPYRGTLRPIWNGRNRLDRFDGEIEIEGLRWTATISTPTMGRGTLTLSCPPTRYPGEPDPKSSCGIMLGGVDN